MALSETAPDRNQMPALIIIVSGAVLAIASFLEWASAEASVNGQFLQSFNETGTQDLDGKITLVCAIVGIAAAVMWMRGAGKPKSMATLALIVSIVGLAIALIYFSTLDVSDDIPASFTAVGGKVETSGGIGLWLALIGALGMLVGSIMLIRSGRGDAAVAAPPPAAPPAA